MTGPWDPIEPFATGHLPVGDGHTMYWEASGNRKGEPALFLHGGPGGGMKTGYRRRFDPSRFLIVGFEQRGCGRSRPRASEAGYDLSHNTTQHLIADIETLRAHLEIEDWLVCGISWGTTLALAYAQAHPERVRRLVLTCVTTTSRREVRWLTEDVGRIFPREWEAFEAASGRTAGQTLIDAYYNLITDPDKREQAATDWCAWEDVHISLDPASVPIPDFTDPEFRLTFATLVIHYWKHAAFISDLEEGMDRIANIPGTLIHGRLDVSSPLETAYRLRKLWPASELIVVENEGHGGEEIIARTIEAIARL